MSVLTHKLNLVIRHNYRCVRSPSWWDTSSCGLKALPASLAEHGALANKLGNLASTVLTRVLWLLSYLDMVHMGLDLPPIVLILLDWIILQLLEHLDALLSLEPPLYFPVWIYLVSEALLVLISEVIIDCLLSDLTSVWSFPPSCYLN